jgi:hypothetical protein
MSDLKTKHNCERSTLVLLVATPCGLVGKYQRNRTVFIDFRLIWWPLEPYRRFRDTCCFHHQNDDHDGDSKYLWNVGGLTPDCPALQPRRQSSLHCLHMKHIPPKPFVFTQVPWRYNPEGNYWRTHSLENLKSHNWRGFSLEYIYLPLPIITLLTLYIHHTLCLTGTGFIRQHFSQHRFLRTSAAW